MCRDTRQPFPAEELSLPLCCLINRQIGLKLILISIAYLQSYAVYQSFSHCQCQYTSHARQNRFAHCGLSDEVIVIKLHLSL